MRRVASGGNGTTEAQAGPRLPATLDEAGRDLTLGEADGQRIIVTIGIHRDLLSVPRSVLSATSDEV